MLSMMRSRDVYEEYILKMEQDKEKEMVKMAQEVQALNRENYKLSVEIYELQQKLECEKEKKEYFNDFLEKVWKQVNE